MSATTATSFACGTVEPTAAPPPGREVPSSTPAAPADRPAGLGRKFRGAILFYFRAAGFGFIACPDVAGDVYFGRRAVSLTCK